jgi:hypothetical protein
MKTSAVTIEAYRFGPVSGRVQRFAYFALTLAVITSSKVSLADKSLLIPAVIDGKPSTIYEKVIVTSSKAQLRPTPGGEGQYIDPFAIFYKLRGDDGKEETAGHVRVGDSQGKTLGWIAKSDLVEWNTRFVLEPLEPTPERTFVVSAGNDTRVELKVVPTGKRRFAFITGAPQHTAGTGEENGPFPVVVCTAEVRSEGTRSFTDELNDLKDMKLEIVFVLETTDFMLSKYDGRELHEYMCDFANQLAQSVKSDKQLSNSKGVRFGIVEYQDTSKKADFAARVQLSLTDDMDQFSSKLKDIRAKEIDGDWPEDVLAGLSMAMKDAGWSQNSIKHIILIGQASMQLDPPGSGANQFGGDWNLITRVWNRSNPKVDCGYNSTGLTIERLIQLANPEGGTIDERARSQVSFHTLWIGKTVEQEIRDLLTKQGDDPDKIISAIETLVKSDDDVIEQFMARTGMDAKTIVDLFVLQLFRYQQKLAQQQYKQLTANRGVEGYSRLVPPNAEDLRQASADLTSKIRETIAATAKIRRGEIKDTAGLQASNNPILQRYYVVVGAQADKFKDQAVIAGTAAIRDERGRLVAQKKLLVTREELTRLKSTFDALHKTFKQMTAKVDRQDVSTILDNLKRAIANTAAGQAIGADVPLKNIITDLPLRTNSLDVTPGDIAVMSSDAFGQWLNKLEASLFRVQDLLDGKTQWMTLNEKAENDKFTFLHLSELP